MLENAARTHLSGAHIVRQANCDRPSNSSIYFLTTKNIESPNNHCASQSFYDCKKNSCQAKDSPPTIRWHLRDVVNSVCDKMIECTINECAKHRKTKDNRTNTPIFCPYEHSSQYWSNYNH